MSFDYDTHLSILNCTVNVRIVKPLYCVSVQEDNKVRLKNNESRVVNETEAVPSNL